MKSEIPTKFKEFVKNLTKKDKEFLESLFDDKEMIEKLNSFSQEKKYWLLYKGWINELKIKFGSYPCAISIFELIDNYKDISEMLKENRSGFEDECLVFDERLNPIFVIKAY